MADADAKRYETPTTGLPLAQGDLFWDCPLPILQAWKIDDTGDGTKKIAGTASVNTAPKQVVVLTQTCDLRKRDKEGNLALSQVAVAPVFARDQMRLNKDQWVNVEKGKTFGLYHLPPFPTGDGHNTLPDSLIDLRGVCTVPRALLDDLCKEGFQRLRIKELYREHLALHFAFSYFRIGLPDEDDTAR